MVRACGLITAFASVALALVVLRAEQTRCAAAARRHGARWAPSRLDMWGDPAIAAACRAAAPVAVQVQQAPRPTGRSLSSGTFLAVAGQKLQISAH